MNSLRADVISVIAVATICALAQKFIGDKGTIASILKLMTGIAMTLAVLSPITDLDFTGVDGFTNQYVYDAQHAVEEGKQITKETLCNIITQQTEAYILDKATKLGADLSVKITVSDEDIPRPQTVTIQGAISPYARRVLQSTIETDLGISREYQEWT